MSSAGTAAPPVLTERSRERSRRVKSGWSATDSSIVGTPMVWVACSCSSSSRCTCASNWVTSTFVADACTIWKVTPWPPTWKSGMVLT